MDNPENMEIGIPPSVSTEIFEQWRNARRGRTHPESQNNPYWSWLLQSETSAWAANQHFDGPSSFGGHPVWSADRFGQSTTELPDGRRILVAGEHEDHYDPDFFIYNDVAIQHPSGEVEFYGYPVGAFPATDFHSSTLRGDQIILIGNLGYPDERRPGTCQILTLDTDTRKISKQESSGDSPGWIHRHRADLAEAGDSILITGGIVCPADPDLPLMENIDDWRLHLAGWRWERLTDRRWPLFELSRADGQPNKLWELRQAVWQQMIPDLKKLSPHEFPAPNDPKALETLEASHSIGQWEAASRLRIDDGLLGRWEAGGCSRWTADPWQGAECLVAETHQCAHWDRSGGSCRRTIATRVGGPWVIRRRRRCSPWRPRALSNSGTHQMMSSWRTWIGTRCSPSAS